MTDETRDTTQPPEGQTPPPPPTGSVPPPPPPEVQAQAPGAPVKADLGRRIVAAIIDGVIAGVVGVIPVVGGLVGAAYMLLRDGLDLDFMKGRSIGKTVMKLRVLRLDGQAMDIGTSVKRNIPFAIGPLIMVVPVLGWIIGPVVAMIIGLIEVILVLTDADGRRMGDKLAETMVVDSND